MRIVHIISGLGTGGAESMLHRLVKQMRGHTHVIISLTSIGTVGKRLLSDGFDVYVLDLRGILGFMSLLRLWFLLRGIKPDVIQTWMYHADLIGSIIGRLSGVKNIIWNIRNTNIPQGRYSLTGLIILICSIISYFGPRKIICCAQSALRLHVALGYSKSKLIVIPNGYNINDINESEAERFNSRLLFDIPNNKVVIGMVGRFDSLKGYDIFVKAAGILAKDHPDTFLFMAAGHDVSDNNEQLNQMILDFAPHAKFKFLGERDDVPNVMQSIDVFCLASRSEGFPNVVAEAMLMQVPCVVTDVGDAKEIVGTSGVVVPPENPLDLAVAINSVVSLDKSVRIELGQSARQRIKDNYSIESIASQYENLYQSLDKL